MNVVIVVFFFELYIQKCYMGGELCTNWRYHRKAPVVWCGG